MCESFAIPTSLVITVSQLVSIFVIGSAIVDVVFLSESESSADKTSFKNFETTQFTNSVCIL